jgi:hypothetical protein
VTKLGNRFDSPRLLGWIPVLRWPAFGELRVQMPQVFGSVMDRCAPKELASDLPARLADLITARSGRSREALVK